MTPTSIPAAPNQSRIQARLISKTRSSDFSDKWLFDIEILQIEALQGGRFAQSGDQVKAFSIAEECTVASGDTITALAEFLGDGRGGQFRLTDVVSAGGGRC